MMDKKEEPNKTVPEDGHTVAHVSSSGKEINAFLKAVAVLPMNRRDRRGRLVFGMDATMSRQPSWDRALAIQADMFHVTKTMGGLDVQLAWFRGFGEFHVSNWVCNPDLLAQKMTEVTCRGGHTQISRVLEHGLRQSEGEGVDAIVYVGDCMEEKMDDVCNIAGQLGLKRVPVFIFQEGRDPVAARAFREVATLSGGAYHQLTSHAAGQLRALLTAVAVYASGGRSALLDYGRKKGGDVRLLAHQIAGRKRGMHQ